MSDAKEGAEVWPIKHTVACLPSRYKSYCGASSKTQNPFAYCGYLFVAWKYHCWIIFPFVVSLVFWIFVIFWVHLYIFVAVDILSGTVNTFDLAWKCFCEWAIVFTSLHALTFFPEGELVGSSSSQECTQHCFTYFLFCFTDKFINLICNVNDFNGLNVLSLSWHWFSWCSW